jgi:2-oxo-3-hexenedioate decarboxylase
VTEIEWDVSRAADVLLDAERNHAARSPLTDEWPELDVATAYQVQDETIRRREAAGERIVGVKLGLTSRAKQERMGISSPVTAWLTDAMIIPEGAPAPLGRLIKPRAEPEIVFLLGSDLSGPGVTAARAIAAVDRVFGGIEVIDSRFTDFRFTLPDVVADNASTAGFTVGSVGVDPRSVDLTLEAVLLEVDGRVVDSATGAAVQGSPAQALALAANTLAERALTLRAGWLVFTGGLTDAVALEHGIGIGAHFTSLGTSYLPAG